MGKKKRNKLSKPTLPKEICAEILVKLPIKQILRCRSVSRMWRSIIDDPHFISMHHRKNILDKQNESRLLVFQPHEIRNPKQLCTIRRANTFRKASTLGIDVDCYTRYEAMGYANGVICLNRYITEFQIDKFFLWNPSIRKGLEIPLPQLAKVKGIYEVDCALGFDPITNDYKIVSSLHIRDGCHFPKYVESFTLSTNSWKTIPMELGPCFWYKNTPKVYLNGVIYWMGLDLMKATPKGKFPYMVSFYVNNEVFKYIHLPNCEEIDDWDHERFPIILGHSSIGLMDVFYNYTNIWVMKEDSSSWTKQYVLNLQLFNKCVYFKSDGNLYFVGDKGGVCSYNIESHEEKVLAKSYKISPLLVGVYVESFMLSNGVDDHVLFTLPPRTTRFGVNLQVIFGGIL